MSAIFRPVFLSSGHSDNPKKDRGASGNGYIEGVLAVEFRKLLYDYLVSKGLKSTMDVNSNKTSETIAYFENLVSKDSILIDIHWNSASATSTGVETLIPEEYTKFELELAHEISKVIGTIADLKLRGNSGGKAGVKTELDSHHGKLGWMRLNGENILIEMCFISNPNDMKKYQNNKMAIVMAVGDVILRFAKKDFSLGISDEKTYVIKPGDTLYGIAKELNINVSVLLTKNNINIKSIIKVGDKLKY